MKEDTLSDVDRKQKGYVPGKTTIEEMLGSIKAHLPDLEVKQLSGKRGEILVDHSLKGEVLTRLKEAGFDHFTALSCIDMIDDDRIQLVYHVWSYGSKGHILVKTELPRKNPSTGTVYRIYRPAITYEREIKEMFGVDFPGNPRLTQFILEDWEGPPPMLKDFDTEAYAVDHFDMVRRDPLSKPPQPKKGGES